jgi:rod shape-determining protein MreC
MFSKQTATIALLVVLLTLSVMVLSLSSRRPTGLGTINRVAIALVSPFQKAISVVTNFVSDTWDSYFFSVNLANELTDMHRELRSARAATYHNQELTLEIRRLSRLLDMAVEMQGPWLAAHVIGKDPSPWFHSVMLDKGQTDGVEVGLPVVSPEGIVGLVIQTTSHSAKVMLITDPNSAVDALVQNSRARGIVKGGLSGFCDLQYMLHKYEVQVGDTVVSSGMDGVFPKGVPVGQVTSIATQESGIFQSIAVTPFVDFNSLEEVLVVPAPQEASPS